MSAVAVYSLRQNNLTMIRLRTNVYIADKNNGDTNGTLRILQAYVTSHMNTNLSGGSNSPYPPIQLQYTYERLQQASTNQAGATNTMLYTSAENYCQAQIPNGFSGSYRISCIEQYIESHGLQTVNIPASLYEFNFLSPTWTPDLAGWSIVASIMLLLLFVISWLAERWLKHQVQ